MPPPTRRPATQAARKSPRLAPATPRLPAPLGIDGLKDRYRGHKRLELCRDLAMGELTHRELAQRESLHISDVETFRSAHENEIAEVRAALAGQLAVETAGLWITKKQNRLAEYQAEIEELRDYLGELRGGDVRWSRAHKDILQMYLSLFKQTADELGAYPQRQQAPARQGQTVHYVIETPDPGALT